MAFIDDVPPKQVPPDQQVPDRDHIIQVHAVHPAVMRHHYDLYLTLMHRPGPLSRRVREMLAVRVSTLNRCHY